MSRAKWKGPCYFQKKKIIDSFITRDSEILPKFIGLTFLISNGKENVELKVTSEMVGHKFGQFVFTRAKFSFKKRKVKKK